jgi:hypothetical protein
MAARLGKLVDMESRIIHAQLDNPVNIIETRRALVCYMQYLITYRQDVPEMDEYIMHELQALLSTKYVSQLQEEDSIYQIIRVAVNLWFFRTPILFHLSPA